MARRRQGARSGWCSGAIQLRRRRTRNGGGRTILPLSQAAGRTWRFRFREAEMTEERKKPLDHKGRIIRVETRVKATPEQIYEAWADPEKIAHWSRWLRRLARPPLRHEGRETPHGKPEGTEQREGEMTQAKSASASRQQERKIKREIELNAPVKEVWKAVTEPEELKRWFPLEARVVPGKGGKI